MLIKIRRKINNWFSGDELGIFLILFFFTLFSFLIIIRLYNLQIIQGQDFRNKVIQKSQKNKKNSIFDRGKIYFKNKNELIPAAIQESGYLLIVNNKYNLFLNNNNPEDVYEKISKIIKIDKKFFLDEVSHKGDPYEKLKSRLTKEETEKLEKLNIKGFTYIRESWRNYPFNEVGGKILGFLNSEKKGVSGLEKSYNNYLTREYDKKKKNIFFNIFSQNIDSLFSKREIKKEGDLYTSIDISIQDFLEDKLKNINEKYNSTQTMGIIMKPSTGEIIAMADNNPLNFNLAKKDYRNNMVESRYEPGSIIKPLIVSIALDSDSIDKNFQYNDTGCMFIKNDKVCDYDKKARGPNVDLTEIIKYSLNLGMVNIQKKIKYDTFLGYFTEKLGLGEETGIDLPNEISQNISSINNLNIPINYATAAFGQGISFSPIAMMRYLSIIANDGFLVTPHIVTKINYGDYIPEKLNVSQKKRVFKIKTIEEIKKIMVDAVNQSHYKQKFQRSGYSIAAKTGTAQIASKEGGYKEGVNLHTFFGFFPVNAKPEDRYAIILYTFEPKARYSSQTLTEPFYDIVDFLISYYDIKPDIIK